MNLHRSMRASTIIISSVGGSSVSVSVDGVKFFVQKIIDTYKFI